MIKNKEDFNRKLRADNQDKYKTNLDMYLKKELISKNNKFKEFIIESYNKGSYLCEFDIDIHPKFLTHIASCEFTSIDDMFKENELNAFLKIFNNYILEEFNLKSVVEEIKSNIQQIKYVEKSDSLIYSEENTYVSENLHIQIKFKD